MMMKKLTYNGSKKVLLSLTERIRRSYAYVGAFIAFLTFGRACSRSGKLKLAWLSSLLIAAFILISCSSEQVEPEVKQGTAIAFSANQQEEEVTRAGSTPLQNTGINSFRVWAIKNNGPAAEPYSTYQTVMEEYRVRYAENSSGSSTTNSNSWDYILIAYPDQTPKYWDWEAKAYRFFAVTGAATVTGNNKVDGTYESYTASIIADATNEGNTPYYSKLWFSTGNTTDYPTRLFGKPVQLEFMQPFSKVRFMLILSDPASKTYTVLEDDDFRPSEPEKNIAKKASVTVTYPMKGNETTEQFEVVANSVTQTLGSFNQRWTEADSEAHPATTENHHWETVIPATNQGSYTYKVTINGEEKSCVVPAQYMDWLPGYNYTYIFKVNAEGGVELATVRTSFTNWQDGIDKEIQLYNW